jgi:phosphonate transport system substrate-binding protein
MLSLIVRRFLLSRGGFLLCGILLLLTASAGSPARAVEPRMLRFATYASERPSEELKKMEPFQQHLEQAMRQAGLPIQLKIRIFPSYDEAVDAVVSGDVDIARLGPVSYVTAKARQLKLPLLAMESSKGTKHFNGVILVPLTSSIMTLADLRGKRFAFGEPLSTTGRYLAQAALFDAGIRASDFADMDYLGRHDKVAFAVAAGTYDAGAVNENTLIKYKESKGLRKLAVFASPTHAWVTRVDFDESVSRQVQKALLEMKGPALKYIDRDGFLSAQDSDFDELRKMMRKARLFNE